MTPELVPECLDCGVCCFSLLDEYVRVTGDDYTQLGERADELTHFLGNRCYMDMHEGHCGALLRSVHGEWLCSIYLDRPSVCRELSRCGAACSAEREAKSDRPPRLLALWRA